MSGKDPGKPQNAIPKLTIAGPLFDQMRNLAAQGANAVRQNEGIQAALSKARAVASVVTKPPPAGNSQAQAETAKRLEEKIGVVSERVGLIAGRVQGGIESAKQQVQQAAAASAAAGGQLVEAVQASLGDRYPPVNEDRSTWFPPAQEVPEPVKNELAEQVARTAASKLASTINATSALDSRLEAKRVAELQKQRRQKEAFEQIFEQVKKDLGHVGSYQEFLKIYSNERIPRDIKVLLNLDELNASLKKLDNSMLLSQRGFIKAQDSLENIGREIQRLVTVQTELRDRQQELKTLVETEQKEQEDPNPFSDARSLELRRTTIKTLQETTARLTEQLKEWTKLQQVSKDMLDMQENTPRLLELYKLAFRRTLLCAIGNPECESIKQRIESMLKEFPYLRSSMYGGRKTRRKNNKKRKTRSRKLYR